MLTKIGYSRYSFADVTAFCFDYQGTNGILNLVPPHNRSNSRKIDIAFKRAGFRNSCSRNMISAVVSILLSCSF